MSQRYLYQNKLLLPMESQDPVGVDPIPGYRMRDWAIRNNCVLICWEREPLPAAVALAQVSPEWVAPTIEWLKRWVIKQ